MRTQDCLTPQTGCPTGHLLNNETGHDVQACVQCAEGKYMANSNDPSLAW